MKSKDYSNGRYTDSPNFNSGQKKRSRQTFTTYQLQILEHHFNQNSFPDREALDKICMALDIQETRLANWFKNRRARTRKEAKDGTGTSPTVDMGEGGEDNGMEDISPSNSPKRKPPPKLINKGNYSIQKIMEKEPIINHDPMPHVPPRMMTALPPHAPPINMPYINSPQPIRQLHNMTSFLHNTPDRSLTSSLSHVLRSQIDINQMTPDMHMRSLRHLESLQCRPFESVLPNYYQDTSELDCPLWDLYYSYNDEVVPVREYFDAVPGKTPNVISGDCGQTLLVL